MDYDLKDIIECVSNGGSLIAWCVERKYRYSVVVNWIYEVEDRKKSYEAALEARGEWVAQRLLLELQKISFIDVRKLFNDDGSIKDVSELDDDVAAAIGGIDIQDPILDKDGDEVTPRTRKIKLVDKLKSIELLGKNLKMFTDKVEHIGKFSLENLVMASMAPKENKGKPLVDKNDTEIKEGDVLKDGIIIKKESENAEKTEIESEKAESEEGCDEI